MIFDQNLWFSTKICDFRPKFWFWPPITHVAELLGNLLLYIYGLSTTKAISSVTTKEVNYLTILQIYVTLPMLNMFWSKTNHSLWSQPAMHNRNILVINFSNFIFIKNKLLHTSKIYRLPIYWLPALSTVYLVDFESCEIIMISNQKNVDYCKSLITVLKK